MERSNKILGLFFTRGMSLEKWHNSGMISREIKIYNELSKKFKKIFFFTYGSEKEFSYSNLLAKNIKILPKKINIPDNIYSLIIPIIYRKEIKKLDIIKTNQMDGSLAAVTSKIIHKKPLVLRCGYEWLSFLKKEGASFIKRGIAYFIEKISYKLADAVILSSGTDKEFVEKKFGVSASKISVLPNYIDTDIFKPFKIKKTGNKIIFVGRLEKQKNLFNLLKAIKNLPVELTLVGNGSLEKGLKDYAKANNLNVKFMGNVSNDKLPNLLNDAEIFTLPSSYEGCPKALLEAMSCGLPCIGADVEGINEIIKHRENGYLCGTSAGSIREAIQKILPDEKLKEKMGANARKTILEKFSLNKILEKELNIYRNLL